MDRLKKNWVYIAAVIALFIVYIIFKALFGGPDVAYITSKAHKGDIEVSVLATGIVKPYRLVAVGARATGRVVRMNVIPGTKVEAGNLLAEIDPITQENALKSAQASLNNFKAQLAVQQAQLLLAQQNLARQTTMLRTNAVSKADFDNAKAQVAIYEAEVAALNAQIESAEVELNNAEVNLSYTRVTAPYSGTVLATVVQEGQNVNAVQSAPTIVIMGDLSKMTVFAEISEADISQVRVGQDVYFNVVGNPTRRYDTKLAAIEPAPESIRSDISFNSSTTSSSSDSVAIYYNGTFQIDNSDGALYTYMTAEVHIVLGQAKDVLLIPSDALNNANGDRASVNVLNGSRVESREVVTGLNDKVMVEIKSGLAEGDVVITGSSAQLGTAPSRLMGGR